MGKKTIKPRDTQKKNWITIGLAIERLKLYTRFLPTLHSRAMDSHSSNNLNVQHEPDFHQLGQLRVGKITSISPEEWTLRMQAPIMEWEVYWETIYKSIYLMNFISGFPQCKNAAVLYKTNIDHLGNLEEARYTFAHFVERLPGMEKAVEPFSIGISKSGYRFGKETWSIEKTDLDKFLNLANDFVFISESEYNSWLKIEFAHNNSEVISDQ